MLKEFKQQFEKSGEIYLRVKVRPGANKTQIKEIMNNETVKIDIAAMPIKGKANQELINFLVQKFDVCKDNVKIINGLKTKDKLVKVVK